MVQLTADRYTLSLHDALPISLRALRLGEPAARIDHRRALPRARGRGLQHDGSRLGGFGTRRESSDRKSTRLNSSHLGRSYGVLCLKKKMVTDQPSLKLNSGKL